MWGPESVVDCKEANLTFSRQSNTIPAWRCPGGGGRCFLHPIILVLPVVWMMIDLFFGEVMADLLVVCVVLVLCFS